MFGRMCGPRDTAGKSIAVKIIGQMSRPRSWAASDCGDDLFEEGRSMNTSLTRRSLMKYAAVAAGASLVGRANRATSAAQAADDPFGGLVPCGQSYSFRRLSLDNALAAMNELGIKQVELFPNHIAGLSPTQVKEKLEQHNVQGVSYGVVPFSKDDAANRKM